jgi:hypothetical protein
MVVAAKVLNPRHLYVLLLYCGRVPLICDCAGLDLLELRLVPFVFPIS